MNDMETATIFNIQRFSTHDGPGIRTVVFLKGCPLRCFWCQNPESQSAKPVLLQNRDLCTGCGRCVSICPEHAVSIENGASVIDRTRCRGCGTCSLECPANALTLSGRTVTVDEVLAEVLKDRTYYLNTGGGVTLSGGEPLLQQHFARELLKRCQDRGVPTAVETCGHRPQEVFNQMMPVTDLFLYDIKTVDGEKHRRGTGQGNELILANAKFLASSGCELLVRMPLIPGFNDATEDVLQLRRFVEGELHLPAEKIELLKYNPLGEIKFQRLDRVDVPHMQPQSDEYFEQLNALLQ